MKVLVFDIWGDFGHFKKFYTTSSPLSFAIPPPTSVYGMLGAILGIDKSEYLKQLNGKTTMVGIQILKPIKKIRMSINLIDTKNSGSFHLIKTRTQIKTEFLKEPFYRFFIHISDEDLFEQLIERVRKKETYYTLSLGLANLIANFEFIDVVESEPLESSEEVNSVILSDNVEDIKIKEGKKYFKERLPIDMKLNREVIAYRDVVMELNGSSMEGEFKNCYKVKDSAVSFISG